MQKTMEGILHYPGYHGCRSFCRIRVYEREDKPSVPPVVIATERDDNPGTSVTNRIEVIATQVYLFLERPPAGITVIEHYEDRAFIGGRATIKETFDLVTFTWTCYQGAIDPRWLPLTKAQVQEILGQPLPG